MDHEQNTIAYIIGNHFETLTQLPNVYTIDQVFSAMMENCLPAHSLWIVGQGIHASVREVLNVCAKYRPELHLHTGSLALSAQEEYRLMQEFFIQENAKKASDNNSLEWLNFHFVESNRVKAELKLTYFSEEDLLTHDFLLTAARELCEKACHKILSNGKLLIKSAQLNSFHRFFPLPISVETKFQLTTDNQRGLKSLTRFYQDYACVAEVHLSFDLFSAEEAKTLLHSLGIKTFTHFSDNINE